MRWGGTGNFGSCSNSAAVFWVRGVTVPWPRSRLVMELWKELDWVFSGRGKGGSSFGGGKDVPVAFADSVVSPAGS